jgi:hypothetical protein
MEVGTAMMSFSVPFFISSPMRATANAAVEPVPRPGARAGGGAVSRLSAAGCTAARAPRRAALTDLHAGLDVLDRLPRRLLLQLILRRRKRRRATHQARSSAPSARLQQTAAAAAPRAPRPANPLQLRRARVARPPARGGTARHERASAG